MNRIILWALPFMVVAMTGCKGIVQEVTNRPNMDGADLYFGFPIRADQLEGTYCKLEKGLPDPCKWAIDAAISNELTGYRRLKQWGRDIESKGTASQKQGWKLAEMQPTDVEKVALVIGLMGGSATALHSSSSVQDRIEQTEFQKLMDPSVRE